MKYYFDISHLVSRTARTQTKYQSFLKDLQRYLEENNDFDSQSSYTARIQGIKSVIEKHKDSFILKTPLHAKEIDPVEKRRALTEPTPWGGVSLKKVDVARNYIRKLLVVNALGVLGFEYHDFKHERLKILEGVCLLIYSNHKSRGWKKGRVLITLSVPGDRATLLPYDEHGVIALSNCVIEEQSTNHLDDLIFIYTS